MKAIVAVDETWGIGKNGTLLTHLPEDMKFFKETTTGQVVIMGRKTLESFPGKKPLPKRVNIVISQNESLKVDGALVVHSLKEALKEANTYTNQEVFVIGGASIYKALLPYCEEAYVTKMQNDFHADTFFPNLDNNPAWKCIEESPVHTYKDLHFSFCHYKQI